jgi:hypothetical protein
VGLLVSAGVFAVFVTALPANAQGSTVQVLAVGDSMIYEPDGSGSGPVIVRKFGSRELGKANFRALGASNPCSAPWARWIRDYPKARIDYVVMEDHYVQGDGVEGACPSKHAWRLAWQDLVNAAKEKGAFVIVLDGNHPDLSTVSGIDILDHPVPPCEACPHYSNGGYKLYARNVVDLLESLIA